MNQKFSTRLKAIREAKKMSRADLALRVGIQESYLEKLERGYQAPPSKEVIAALAKSLGTDADELFALAVKLPPDIERALLTTPQLVQLVRVGMAWSEKARFVMLQAYDVPLSKLAYQSGPLPNFDVDRSRREPITREMKLAVFRLDNNECVYCSSTTLLEVDHIQPDSLGGTNEIENLVTCCDRCNKKKANRTTPPLVFGRFRGEVEQ